MNRPLRVLHVLAELKPSGAETMLVAAAEEFRRLGVVAEVLSIGANLGPYAEQFRSAGYPLHHIPLSRSPAFFLRQRALMKAGRYDVIHLHCEAANFWQGLTALSAGNGGVIRTIHNAFDFKGSLRWTRGIQRRILRRLGLRHVAISASVQDNEQRCYQLPTEMVWNWYNSDRFVVTTAEERLKARSSLQIDDDAFVIASIGNCSPVKNHDSIIRAMALLEPSLQLVYLHAGLEQAGAPERELAAQLGVSGRVRFLGGLKDVLPMLQASDAFVMPSVYEGFGIAAIEALATGLPALFSDVPGLRDFRPLFPELVYTDTSSEGVAKGIQILAELAADRREEILRQYPEIARCRFGMARGVAEYLAIYRSAAKA